MKEQITEAIKEYTELGLTARAAELQKLSDQIPFVVKLDTSEVWADFYLSIFKPEKYPHRNYTESPETIKELNEIKIMVVDACMRMAPMGGFGLMYLIEGDGVYGGGVFSGNFSHSPVNINFSNLFNTEVTK